MKAPCELIVWYVLPTIRAELAKELKVLGFTQKEISERLGITQAAVSQYMKEKIRKISYQECALYAPLLADYRNKKVSK